MIIKIIFFAALFLVAIMAFIIIDNKFLGRRFHTLLVFPEEYHIYKYIVNNQRDITRSDKHIYNMHELKITYAFIEGRPILWVTNINDPKARILFSNYNEYYAKKLAKILGTKVEKIIC